MNGSLLLDDMMLELLLRVEVRVGLGFMLRQQEVEGSETQEKVYQLSLPIPVN